MSDINIKLSDLEGKKLFIGIPMYGGMGSAITMKTMIDLSSFLSAHGLPFQTYFISNESLITRARNGIADEFLKSDATHLFFLDADIGMDFKDIIALFHFCDGKKYPILTAPYPKKTISWEKIHAAVQSGIIKHPSELKRFMADFVFNMADVKQTEFQLDEFLEIGEGGTGAMMIHRSALEHFAKTYPKLKYVSDHVRSKEYDKDHKITAFFDTEIDPKTKRYLSEDYMFSKYCRRIGLKIHMAPWMTLQHQGSMIFEGDIGAIASIGESPTASERSYYNKE